MQRLTTVQGEVAQMQTQNARLKTMLGIGGFTQAEIDEMKQNSSDDQEMTDIETQFAKLAVRGVTVIVASGDDGSDYKPTCPTSTGFDPSSTLANTGLTATHRRTVNATSWPLCCMHSGGADGWT